MAATPLDDKALLAMASEFTVLDDDGGRTSFRSVTVRRMRQADGSSKWAVYVSGTWACDRNGDWDDEPPPSSRTSEYLDSHRFSDLGTAMSVADLALARVRAEWKRMREPLPRETVQLAEAEREIFGGS